VAASGTALAVAPYKTLAAVEGAAEITLVTGATIAATGSCFGASALVGNAEASAAAGCEVVTAEVEVGPRSTYSTIICSGLQYICGCEAEVVIVAVEKYDCGAVPVHWVVQRRLAQHTKPSRAMRYRV